MTISDYVNMFIDDRLVYVENITAASYRFYLNRFLDWIPADDFTLLTKSTLKGYILFLRGTMKNTSVRTCYRPVKAFCKWLYQEDYLETDITVGIKLPKSDAAIVEPLTSDEVNLIDEAIINCSLNNLISLRNYCIFHLMLDCGLRRKEVINLKYTDIKFGRLIIRQAKGNKDRIVLLPQFLFLSIRNYCNSVYGDDCVPSSSLFLDVHNSKPITIDTIRNLFQDLKQQSGVTRIHAHLCRHTFATSYLQYGGDMEKLRLYMGHSGYEILKNYLHISLVYSDIYKLDDFFFQDMQKV